MPRRESFQPSAVDPPKYKSTVEVWNGGNVPGIGRQRAGLESLEVVDDVGDNHLHKFVREGGRGLYGGCHWSFGTPENSTDFGFAPVPNYASKKVQPFATSRTRWSEADADNFSWAVVPDTEDMGFFERLPSPFEGDIAVVSERENSSDSAAGSDHECKRPSAQCCSRPILSPMG